jgi:outer membrane beta-barrel protein
MRRLLAGAVFTISVSGLSGLASAHSAEAAPPSPDKSGDDEDLVLEDDGPPADAPSEPAINLNDTSFMDVSSGDSGDASDPLAAKKPAAGAGGAADVEIDADALDEKMISVVSRQPMLNVYKDDPDGDGQGRTIHRWDIQPQIGMSINDPYVRNYAFGAEINWWITNRLAIGAGGHYFIGQRTNNYNTTKRQQHLLITANRFVWEASGALLYEPFYGKIAIFNKFLLHWESYFQLGGGVIQSTVIPRFEAIHQPFSSIVPQGNVALGARFYLPDNKYMSVNMGVRTWIFRDNYEPQKRDPDPDKYPLDLTSPEAAKANADRAMAYNAVFFLGLSFYLPTDFQYSTRR